MMSTVHQKGLVMAVNQDVVPVVFELRTVIHALTQSVLTV